MNEGAGRAWHGVIAAVAAFVLLAQMILVVSVGSVIQGAPRALSSWVYQLIGYVTTLGLGMPRAAIGLVIGLLAGSAVKGRGDRRLSTGCWHRVDRMSSAQLMSFAIVRPS